MFGLTVCIVVDNGHVSQVFVQGRKLSTCSLHTQAVFPSLLHLLRKLSHSFLTLNSYQFLFCKHFSEINYDRVFENYSSPFKLNEEDIYYMDQKALSWILETKSDEVYTN